MGIKKKNTHIYDNIRELAKTPLAILSLGFLGIYQWYIQALGHTDEWSMFLLAIAVTTSTAFVICSLRISINLWQPAKPKSAKGYVYLLKAPNRLWKLGKTHDLKQRLRSYKTAHAEVLDFTHVIYTTDRHALEKHFKAVFAERKVEREWYALTEADVKHFQDYSGEDRV